jgi:hypothetical protein
VSRSAFCRDSGVRCNDMQTNHNFENSFVLAGECSFFMEKQVMSTFVRILRESKTITAVAVQLLQTLSIMIQNITSKHARCMCYDYGDVFCIASNRHVQSILVE